MAVVLTDLGTNLKLAGGWRTCRAVYCVHAVAHVMVWHMCWALEQQQQQPTDDNWVAAAYGGAAVWHAHLLCQLCQLWATVHSAAA